MKTLKTCLSKDEDTRPNAAIAPQKVERVAPASLWLLEIPVYKHLTNDNEEQVNCPKRPSAVAVVGQVRRGKAHVPKKQTGC